MMDAYIGGAWRSVASGDVRIDGQWRRLTRCEAYIGGAWRTGKTFTPPLSVSISPTTLNAISLASPVISEGATATPTGGLGPYTYSWTRITGTLGSATSPTLASTNFAAFTSDGESGSSTFRCTVTDSRSSTATADITVFFSDIDGV
jgi:hypothetical protein